jgi:transposase
VPEGINSESIEVWFQDEARFGQQNTVTRVWAKTGTRPRVVRQRQFISTYLFGAVCPATGQSVGIVMPRSNTDAMTTHLRWISDSIKPGKHAVVVMDQAGWHTTSQLPIFDNLTVVFLPPYSPELNPIERVWLQLRQDYLANRCFADYDDIVDSVCLAWNAFTSASKNVISLCNWSWVEISNN